MDATQNLILPGPRELSHWKRLLGRVDDLQHYCGLNPPNPTEAKKVLETLVAEMKEFCDGP